MKYKMVTDRSILSINTEDNKLVISERIVDLSGPYIKDFRPYELAKVLIDLLNRVADLEAEIDKLKHQE